MTLNDRVKVRFEVSPDGHTQVKTESLWAESVGDGRFRILNSPFFLFGISAEDVVAVKLTKDGLTYERVISRGGHSTYRVYLQGGRSIEDPEFRAHWEPIALEGATFENANGYFIAVDIPPDKNVAAIYKLLALGEDDRIWAFEEVYYAGR